MGPVIEANHGEDLAQAKDLAQTMAERIMGTRSHAEALRTLRASFPESSLTARVAALAILKRSSDVSAANRT
jgi:hypothetical protein